MICAMICPMICNLLTLLGIQRGKATTGTADKLQHRLHKASRAKVVYRVGGDRFSTEARNMQGLVPHARSTILPYKTQDITSPLDEFQNWFFSKTCLRGRTQRKWRFWKYLAKTFPQTCRAAFALQPVVEKISIKICPLCINLHLACASVLVLLRSHTIKSEWHWAVITDECLVPNLLFLPDFFVSSRLVCVFFSFPDFLGVFFSLHRGRLCKRSRPSALLSTFLI